MRLLAGCCIALGFWLLATAAYMAIMRMGSTDSAVIRVLYYTAYIGACFGGGMLAAATAKTIERR